MNLKINFPKHWRLRAITYVMDFFIKKKCHYILLIINT